jgi:hypothetical protein
VAQEGVTGAREDRRQLLRRICLAVLTVTGALWLGEVLIAALVYALLTRHSATASLTWELGRWDRWGFTASGGQGSAAMVVMGIWWILVPVIAVAAATLARRLKASPPAP